MSEFTNEGFNVGYRAGILAERERILLLIEESDSACSQWAIALINGEN